MPSNPNMKPNYGAAGTGGLFGAARMSRVAMIAALYAATSLFALLFLGGLAWGPVQLRISEALCILALMTPDAIAGLALGCAVANFFNIFLGGLGLLGIFDVIFGALATACGAYFMWRMRSRPLLALLGPVVANALIVPVYLPLIMQGIGFYTIPFTSIALEGNYVWMYLFGFVSIFIGEALVMYLLGWPLAKALHLIRPSQKS